MAKDYILTLAKRRKELIDALKLSGAYEAVSDNFETIYNCTQKDAYDEIANINYIFKENNFSKYDLCAECQINFTDTILCNECNKKNLYTRLKELLKSYNDPDFTDDEKLEIFKKALIKTN